MAEPQPREVSSDLSGETSESTLQLNIKTLDSRIYSFNVDKNILVASFKEKIASQSGVAVGQQRLIFRGKVLKDDHLLSDYNVENGDTLHLVVRQPQSASELSTGEAASSSSNRGHDSNAGGSRGRIGPIAHSIVLGTLNVGDPGEAVVPDLSRVIGTVLNSIGISNQAGVMQAGVPSNGNQAEGSQANAGSQSRDGNQSVPLQAFHGQSASNTMQIPIGAAVAAPSLNTPIPDSLNTLIEFMNRMELELSQNGNQQNQSTTARGDLPTVELPSNSHGLPTVEALSIVLQHAQQLLSGHAVPALSHTADRLNQEGVSNDPAIRGQVQTESAQLGMAMQHLGALFLELGRTILTLRMGQSPAESFVNAGPAVYISPSGPNPIMVQPFPLQTNSLFGGASGVSANPVAVGSVGVSTVPRNVNIHIHTGASLAPVVSTVGTRVPTVEGVQGGQGGRSNVTESGESVQTQGLSGINITATAVPPQRSMVSISSSGPPGTGISQPPDSNSVSAIVAEINAQLRRQLAANMPNETHSSAGQAEVSTNEELHGGGGAEDDGTSSQNTGAGDNNDTPHHATLMDDQKEHAASEQLDIKETVDFVNSSSEPSINSEGSSQNSLSASNLGNNSQVGSSGVPLGLGLGGLQTKKRARQPTAQTKGGAGASPSNQDQQSRAVGQQVLRSLASLSSKGNTQLPSGQPQDPVTGDGQAMRTATQNDNGPSDVADAMSQILHNPALDGLLAGVSQQTGIGSPDMLRNMLQEFTQNPAMRNTVNQIAQQVDSHDLGSMFAGMDSGPGGGVDLSRMMQQMMPIVSQALGGISSTSQLTSPSELVLPGSMLRRESAEINNHPQIDLEQIVQMLENRSSSEEIFQSIVDRALNLSIDGVARESIVNELRSQGHLAQEFVEMLCRDIYQRFGDEMGS